MIYFFTTQLGLIKLFSIDPPAFDILRDRQQLHIDFKDFG